MPSVGLLVLSLALLVVACAATTELWVSGAVGASGNTPGCGAQGKPCGTIKFAMAQAQTGPIEIVLVHGYTYSDPEDYGLSVQTQNVSFRPDEANSPTIVDCGGHGQFLQVTNQDGTGRSRLEVAIHALTFTRCVGITETVNGGVLSVKGPVNVIITDSNFNQNRAKNGGVLSVLGYSNNAPKSAPTIRLNGDNVFYNNSALMSGGAIYSENSFVDLSGATFEANTASLGGAIYWTSTYGLSLNGASFRSNRATSSNDAGSALYTSSSGIVNINDVTFTSNHANGKGTVMFYFGPRATLKSVTFTSNTAYGGGAGVALSSQTIANIEDGVFVSNSGAKGAALMLSGGSKLNAKRVVFRQNRSAFGALYFQSSSGTVQSSVFDANTGEDGAAIYASIHCTVTVRDTIVKDNKATDQGAGFFCDQSTYSLYNVSFSNNVAGKTPSSSKEQDMYCDTLEANGFCEVDGDPLWSKHCKLAYDSGKVPLPKWLVGTLIGLGVFIFLLILAVAFWMYQVRRRSRATASPDGSGGYEHLSTDDADTTEGPRTTQLGPWGVVTNPNDIHYADETEEDVDDGLVQNRQNFSDD